MDAIVLLARMGRIEEAKKIEKEILDEFSSKPFKIIKEIMKNAEKPGDSGRYLVEFPSGRQAIWRTHSDGMNSWPREILGYEQDRLGNFFVMPPTTFRKGQGPTKTLSGALQLWVEGHPFPMQVYRAHPKYQELSPRNFDGHDGNSNFLSAWTWNEDIGGKNMFIGPGNYLIGIDYQMGNMSTSSSLAFKAANTRYGINKNATLIPDRWVYEKLRKSTHEEITKTFEGVHNIFRGTDQWVEGPGAEISGYSKRNLSYRRLQNLLNGVDKWWAAVQEHVPADERNKFLLSLYRKTGNPSLLSWIEK